VNPSKLRDIRTGVKLAKAAARFPRRSLPTKMMLAGVRQLARLHTKLAFEEYLKRKGKL